MQEITIEKIVVSSFAFWARFAGLFGIVTV